MRKNFVLILVLAILLMTTGCASESEAMMNASIKKYHEHESEAWLLYHNNKTMLDVPDAQEFIQSAVKDLKPCYPYRICLILKDPDEDADFYETECLELRVPQGAGETCKKAIGEELLAMVAKELEISDDNELYWGFLDDEPGSWQVSSVHFDYGRYYAEHTKYEREVVPQ